MRGEKAHMTSLALTAPDCGPSTLMSDLGRWGHGPLVTLTRDAVELDAGTAPTLDSNDDTVATFMIGSTHRGEQSCALGRTRTCATGSGGRCSIR
jgi:hypothetical protein